MKLSKALLVLCLFFGMYQTAPTNCIEPQESSKSRTWVSSDFTCKIKNIACAALVVTACIAFVAIAVYSERHKYDHINSLKYVGMGTLTPEQRTVNILCELTKTVDRINDRLWSLDRQLSTLENRRTI